MLRILGRMRFGVAQRNFFPVPPRYPEPDELTYRPRITTFENQLDQHEKVYRRKFLKVKDRVKSRVLEITKANIARPEKQKVKLRDQVAQILSEVYFDPETKLPVGLFFDDFIMDIKAQRGSQSGQKQEAEYAKKVNLLMDKLRYMNEAQRKQYAIELLTKTEAPQHIKEARNLIFERIVGAIQKLPTKEREQYTQEKIENMIDSKTVDVVTEQLAREKISKNLKYYDIKVPPQPPKQYEEITKELGFYESPVTEEGASDDERLLNMRYARPSDGQEALQTQESIRDKVNMDFIKRAYLNKLDKQQRYLYSPEDNPEQYDERDRLVIKTEQERLMSYFDRVSQESVEMDIAAQSINKKIEEKTTFDTIVDCIDHLLLDAPKFIKDMYYDKNNKNKPYESRFQDVESQVSLLWKDFDDTFPVIFPEIKKQPEQDEETLEKQIKIQAYGQRMKEMMVNDDVDEDELFQIQSDKLEQEIYPIELYKEMLQPNNVQFFHHYLTNIFRLNHEQINDGMASYNYNLNPYTYQVPDTAMMYDDADQDFDDKQAELEEFKIDDNKNIQISELVQKDYNEASLLTYVGRGKRKSSICYVQLKKGTGEVTINGKNVINYFPHPYFRRTALRVLELVQLSCLVDVEVLIKGGSQSAQSQCMCYGLSRAIVKMCPSAKGLFRKLQLTLTDNRQVERKKIGLYKARRKYPYSRR